MWQDTQPALNIKASPLFIILKSVIQVLFVILNITLARQNELAHGFVFTAIVGVYILVLGVYIVPFNYDFANVC